MKLQYFGHLMQRNDSLEKTLMIGKTEGRRRRRQQDGITNSWSLLKLMLIKSVIPFNHLLLFHPLPLLFHPLPLLPSIFPSIRVFSNESFLCIRWPKYWGFSFSISPSNEYAGLISFRIDWLDLSAVQGTLKSATPQFKSINSSGAQLSL